MPPLDVNSVISALNFSEAEALFPCESIKTLGMLFDYKLNLSDHLTESCLYVTVISEIWVR